MIVSGTLQIVCYLCQEMAGHLPHTLLLHSGNTGYDSSCTYEQECTSIEANCQCAAGDVIPVWCCVSVTWYLSSCESHARFFVTVFFRLYICRAVFSPHRLDLRPFWRRGSTCTNLCQVKTELRLTTRSVWESV